jgi:peptidoglycan/xylan/chitin deacetylase (PgdA/CDA1 family)
MNSGIRTSLKRAVYRTCKFLGLFALARILTRRHLRILCYHGLALCDENKFSPGLFMDVKRFESRMQYLKRSGYSVLRLGEAYRLLRERGLPKDAVVITVDDGFYSTFKYAQPIFLRHSFPATVYVTSYYCGKQTPVFRLVVQYLFWKAGARHMDTSELGLPDSVTTAAVKTQADRDRVMWDIIRFGESEIDEPARCKLAAALADRVGVDYLQLAQSRMMNLMNSREIGEMAEAGLDVQLHTHRHCLPTDKYATQHEVQQNREYLEPLVGRKLNHLCYPSGIWSREHWPWLQELGVQTATTCDIGLNCPGTPPLGLKRFLDGDKITAIDFEAEVSGFSELLRRGRCLIDNKRSKH